jgi:magnesium transporter
MATPELTTRILRRLLASGLTTRAERLIARVHAADLGPLLANLSQDETGDLLFQQRRAAARSRAAPTSSARSSGGMTTPADVLGRLEVDDIVHLVAELPEERRAAVVGLLPEDRRADLRKAELYPEHSAGRVMTTDFVALDAKMTAQEAIDHIRARGSRGETDAILYLCASDDEGLLQGVVPIRRLVTSAPDRPCGELMIREPVSVRADTDQEEVARIVARYNLLAVPVVDADGRMVGLITVDDVIDVIQEEATEDIYNLAGLDEEERVFSPVGLSVRKRLPWMVVNLATAFLAASVVGLFRHTIEQVVTLAIFMPVVAGMGGTPARKPLRSSRGISSAKLNSRAVRAVGKQFLVCIAVGAVTGCLGALVAYYWGGSPVFGMVVFVAMLLSMAVAGLAGAAVPLILKALKQDPALGSGVLVTTLTDAVAFFTFLGIATLSLERLSSGRR